MINPTQIVEVLSSSTEDYDRGAKLTHYQQCPSVQAVLFVSHREPLVMVVTRQDGDWKTTVGAAGMVSLVEPSLELSVDELYDGIELVAPDSIAGQT